MTFGLLACYKRCLGWHYHAQKVAGPPNKQQSRVNSDAAEVLASSPKDVPRSTAFSCRRKATSDCSFVMKDGKEFQARAAATGNARLPPHSWKDQCRRGSRPQATAAGCQMQSLGDVPCRCIMKALESQNTKPKLYPVWNSQPVEFIE